MVTYLLGVLQGFCHLADCSFSSLPCDNATILFETLEKKEPLIVFINLTEAEKIIHCAKWSSRIQSFVQKKNIWFCGIGNGSIKQNQAVQDPIFAQVYNEPINIEEILAFVRMKIEIGYERRRGERRTGGDRRKQLRSNGKNYEPGVNNSSRKKEYFLAAGVLTIDYDAMRVTLNDHSVEVSPKEFQLIHLFMQNLGRLVRAEDIIKAIWSENHRATKADVHQYIYMLRHKLEENPHKPKLLITVKGYGYKIGINS